jgi:hypothetical protein
VPKLSSRLSKAPVHSISAPSILSSPSLSMHSEHCELPGAHALEASIPPALSMPGPIDYHRRRALRPGWTHSCSRRLNRVALKVNNGSTSCRKTYEQPFFGIPDSLSAAPVLELVVKHRTATMTMKVNQLSTSNPTVIGCTGIATCCVTSHITG